MHFVELTISLLSVYKVRNSYLSNWCCIRQLLSHYAASIIIIKLFATLSNYRFGINQSNCISRLVSRNLPIIINLLSDGERCIIEKLMKNALFYRDIRCKRF